MGHNIRIWNRGLDSTPLIINKRTNHLDIANLKSEMDSSEVITYGSGGANCR